MEILTARVMPVFHNRWKHCSLRYTPCVLLGFVIWHDTDGEKLTYNKYPRFLEVSITILNFNFGVFITESPLKVIGNLKEKK